MSFIQRRNVHHYQAFALKNLQLSNMSNPWEPQDAKYPLLEDKKNSNPYIQADCPNQSQMVGSHPDKLHPAPYGGGPMQYYPPSPPTHLPAGLAYPAQPTYQGGTGYPVQNQPYYAAANYAAANYAAANYAAANYPAANYAAANYAAPTYAPPPAYHKPNSQPISKTSAATPTLKHSPVSAPVRETLPSGVLHCTACGRETVGLETTAFGCVSALWCFCLLPTGILWMIPACSSSCKDKRKLCTECGTILVETPATCC